MWGMAWGSAIMAISFLPALIGFLAEPRADIIRDASRFLTIALGYFSFSLAAGATVGALRPFLRSYTGAGCVGALLGAVGFVALIVGSRINADRVDSLLVGTSAALGVCVGAFLGVWVRSRANESWRR